MGAAGRQEPPPPPPLAWGRWLLALLLVCGLLPVVLTLLLFAIIERSRFDNMMDMILPVFYSGIVIPVCSLVAVVAVVHLVLRGRMSAGGIVGIGIGIWGCVFGPLAWMQWNLPTAVTLVAVGAVLGLPGGALFIRIAEGPRRRTRQS